jgi:hypothetical protein
VKVNQQAQTQYQILEIVISNLALKKLRSKLQHSNAIAFDGVNLLNLVELNKEIIKLEKIVKNGGSDSVPKDRIIQALSVYLRNNSIENISQARLVCYGILQKLNDRNSIIEDREGIVKLLDYVESYKSNSRPFRRCYKGLLNNYFIYDPQSKSASQNGKLGWSDLKDFLIDHLDHLSTSDLNPDWIEALIKHENLLHDNPCARYGLEALRGDRSVFDEIRNKLEIQDDSWVLKELVNAQIDAATELDDQEFKNTIEHLINLLSEHDFVNECLGKIINRYSKCTDTSVNYLLRDFSVSRWKNPWLKGNEFRWTTVSVEGKKMVTAWLKLHLITEFFEFLSEDGSNDTRRVDFWKSYHIEIEDMYFALGPKAVENNTQHFLQIKKAMDGRLFKLAKGGSQTNNAFIMKVKNYLFVEFGQVNNAAYVFDMNKKLPFDLNPREMFNNEHEAVFGYDFKEIYGDNTELKNKESSAFVNRFIHKDHKDRQDGTWEEEFELFIYDNLSIKKEGSELFSIRPFMNKSYSMISLKGLADKNNLLVEDRSRQGGFIEVSTTTESYDWRVVRILASWGFSWSSKRQTYYK